MFSIYNRKKIIAVILALALLCGALVSCGSDDDEASTDSVAEDTAPDGADSTETEPEGERVVLASNGKSDFTIWVASDIYVNYPDIVSQINDVTSLIKNKTGATVEIMSDSSYSVRASKKPGILIGNTRFAESQSMKAEMKNKDYYVGLSGDKILLYGGDVDGVSKAIRYFYITVLSAQTVVDKTMVFDTAEHTLRQTEKYDINSIKCADTELSNFSIVVSADATVNESTFAYALRYWLYNRYGHRMNIVDDNTAESEHEILVGNTDRQSVGSLETDEYSISVSDGKLCLAAGGMISYNRMYSYITETLFRPIGSADYTLAADYSLKTSAATSIDDGSSLLSAKTGEIRMMSYNVFSNIVNYEDGTSTGPIALRQSLQLEMIRAYAPDVVGLQEFSVNYDSFAPLMTELGYEQVPLGTIKMPDGATTQVTRSNNALFYNSQKLELVTSGYRVYTGIEVQKAAQWAVFKVRETGKLFVAISTHFMWNSPKLTKEEANEARKLNATELIALISEIRAAGYPNIPVIMGGDYNCNTSSEALTSIQNAGFSCARALASQKNDTNGHHTYSRYDNKFQTYTVVYSPNKKHSSAIDHMFVSSGITVNSFAAITLPYALYASDHCPMITDFTVN